MTLFVSCSAQQSECTVQGFWWRDICFAKSRFSAFKVARDIAVVQTMYPPLNVMCYICGGKTVCLKVLVGIPSTEFMGQAIQMMVQVHMISKETQMTMLNLNDTFLQRIWFHADRDTWSDWRASPVTEVYDDSKQKRWAGSPMLRDSATGSTCFWTKSIPKAFLCGPACVRHETIPTMRS